MAAPFWRGLAAADVFWVSRPALIESVRFLDLEAVFNPGTAPVEGFRPL
jgi:hypothetical protein